MTIDKNKITDNVLCYARKKRTICSVVLLVLIGILQILRKSSYVREYVFSRGISRAILSVLASVSNLFPFSLTEIVVYGGVVFGIFMLVKIIKSIKKGENGKRDFSYAGKMLHRGLNIYLAVVVIFLLTFTLSYERDSAIPQLDLPDVEVNAESVADATIYFAEKTKELEEYIEFDEEGNPISPYTFDELSEMILELYQEFDGNDFFSGFDTQPKQLVFGFVNSYLGFTGYYSPIFAESNINTYQPAVSLPVTIAHELAHSKGVMRENEANFFAYYLLSRSDDVYLQYCGCLVSAQILLSESYDPNDVDAYRELYSNFSDSMLTVIYNKYDFWQGYETIFDDIGTYFNNLYLTSSGVSSGVKSYGETADILVRLAQKMQAEENVG